MRHLRTLGVSLVAVFALGAAAAATAMASGNPWLEFSNCPVNNPLTDGCTFARSGAGSFFQAGKVNVPLIHPITLKGAFTENELGEQLYIGPEYGNKAVAPVAQPAPSLTEGVDAELLPPAEKARYEEFVAAGKTKVTATVELAGPASSIYLNEEHLLLNEGEFLGLPVQVKLSNPFLGNYCYVGSNSHPINIAFTDGTTSPPPPNKPITGSLGELTTKKRTEARVLYIKNNEIVNNDFAAPGVTGCGVGGAADEAINAALGLPSPAGSNTAIIRGELDQAGVEAVREKLF